MVSAGRTDLKVGHYKARGRGEPLPYKDARKAGRRQEAAPTVAGDEAEGGAALGRWYRLLV